MELILRLSRIYSYTYLLAHSPLMLNNKLLPPPARHHPPPRNPRTKYRQYWRVSRAALSKEFRWEETPVENHSKKRVYITPFFRDNPPKNTTESKHLKSSPPRGIALVFLLLEQKSGLLLRSTHVALVAPNYRKRTP